MILRILVAVILAALLAIGFQEFRVQTLKMSNESLKVEVDEAKQNLKLCSLNTDTLANTLDVQNKGIARQKEYSNTIKARQALAEEKIKQVQRDAALEIEKIQENASRSCEEAANRLKEWANSLQ